MKKLKYPILSFAVAISLLVLFMHFVGWGELYKVYQNTNPYILLVALLLSTTGYTLNAHVWKTILKFLKIHMPFLKLLKLFYMSLFANYITPFGQAGGEPFMAFILSKRSKIAYGKALATVVSCDILGAISPILFAAIGLVYYIVFMPVSTAMFQFIISVIVVGIVLMGLIIFLQIRKSKVEHLVLKIMKFVRFVLRLLKKDGKFVENKFGHKQTKRRVDMFYDTFNSVVEKKRTELVFFALMSALARVVTLYYVILALGANPNFFLILAVLPLASLSNYLPLPGGLGGMEIAIAALLVTLAGLPLGLATGAALIHRFINYWIPLGVGGILTSIDLRKPLEKTI